MAKEGLAVDDLRTALAQKKIAPVYLFYGEEDFLVEQGTDLIINAVLSQDERGFNLDVMYGSDADTRDIISHASSFPMMSERRVVVVHDVDKLTNKELLASYVEQPLSSTCLVLQCVKPDFRKKPFVTAKRTATVIKCDPLREYEVGPWIVRRIKEQGWAIDQDAARILSGYVSTSLREIQNELDKLYIFIGSKRTILPDDIRSVVGVSKEYNIFELQNVIGSKNLARSTEIITRMLDSGESPILIIVMLTRYFTALWKLHDLKRRGASNADIASTVGVNPYFVKDYVAAATHFQAHDVEYAFEVLAQTDEQLKSSSCDQVQLMQAMVLGLMGQKGLVA